MSAPAYPAHAIPRGRHLREIPSGLLLGAVPAAIVKPLREAGFELIPRTRPFHGTDGTISARLVFRQRHTQAVLTVNWTLRHPAHPALLDALCEAMMPVPCELGPSG